MNAELKSITFISLIMVALFAFSGCEILENKDADTSVTSDTLGTDTVGGDTNSVDTSSGCEGLGEKTVCVDGEDKKVFNTNECGEPTTIAETCVSATFCEVNSVDGQASCACPLTGALTCKSSEGRFTLYEETFIAKERACESNVSEPEDFVESCGFGEVCFQEEGFNNGEPLCHRSVDVSQADKPYYDHSCGTFSTWLRHPTSLEIDCRCRLSGDGSGGPGGTGGHVDPNNLDITEGGHPGGPVINCSSPTSIMNNVWPVDYGEGPSFNAWYQQSSSGASWFSGDVDPVTREMYSIIKWTNSDYVNSATVVAWNLDTGNRRIISGLYPNPQLGQEVFGSGYLSQKPGTTGTVTEQPLSGAHVLRIGPDGMIYTFGGGSGEGSDDNREIVRINPTTGERTLAWLAQNPETGDITADWGQCFRPNALDGEQSVGLQSHGFEVGPDGVFYVSMHGQREGDGILSISADGQTCTILSAWGGQGHSPGGGATPVEAVEVGSGLDIQFPVQGLLWHDGLIHGVSKSNMYGFDPTTGQRTLESYAPSSYGGMGFTRMFWDPTREVIWAMGSGASYGGAIVDLTTGRREGIYSDSGRDDYGSEAILNSVYSESQGMSPTALSNSHVINYGGVILDPTNNNILYMVVKTGALIKFELSTFNSYIISW